MRSTATTKLPQLIILDGATGSGKSSLLEHLHENYTQAVLVGAKLTTRKKRLADNDWEFRFTSRIPKQYERYSFSSVGNQYAVNVDEFQNAIQSRLTYAISCVDRRTSKLLSSRFSTVAIYVYRSWTQEELEALFQIRGTSCRLESELRREEIASIAKEYYDKIDIYDHVILNVGSRQEMIKQLAKILRLYGITQDRLSITTRRKSGCSSVLR